MDSRHAHAALLMVAMVSMGASYRTKNFVVRTSTPELAQEIAELAETLREELSLEWTGESLPTGERPCLIHAEIADELAANGLTQARFGDYGLASAQIMVRGSRERVLRSVLPHEITHLIFASLFGPAMPRWADEGASITVEHEGDQADQHQFLLAIVDRGQAISLSRLFSLHDYPADSAVMYTQGFSLTQFLIEQGGRKKFTRYLAAGLETNDWHKATRQHYKINGLPELERRWMDWVLASRERDADKQAASAAPTAIPALPVSNVQSLTPVQR